jgi:hypothetical protein
MTITEPLRVVEDEWPELARKLPPKAPSDDQRGKGHQLRKTPADGRRAGVSLQRVSDGSDPSRVTASRCERVKELTRAGKSAHRSMMDFSWGA